jgi:recombination protein RecT
MTQQAPKAQVPAKTTEQSMVDLVAQRVDALAKAGRLAFPPDYHPGNALMAAWLKIKGTLDKDKRPAHEVCTKESVQLALLDMIVQGLTPSKEQCYFVVHGTKLTMMRSYFGTVAVCLRVTQAADAWAYPIYQDDDFAYEIANNRMKVVKHVQKLANVKADKLMGAYSVIDFGEGKGQACEIMTIDQIKQAWRMNRFYKPEDPDDAHNRFPDMMARKTVLSRLAKQYVNRSSDNALLLEAFNRSDDEAHEAAIAGEIEAEATKVALPEGKTAEAAKPEPTQQPARHSEGTSERDLGGPGW